MPASRYLRQIMVWGGEAQEALASSRVLVAGLGGLGSAAS
ncbi:MAG: ThiF family adenylyltransferase, partial [Thermofilaceae archaeon]